MMAAPVRRFGTVPAQMPDTLRLEPRAKNLAALVLSDSMLQLRDDVVAQWTYPEAYDALKQYGIYPANKLFFYGPPGNGKTTAAQWLAAQLDVPLYRVLCESLVDSYLGRTGNNVGQLMSWLQDQPKCVVLFDEIETIFPSREANLGTTSREIASAMAIMWQYLDRWQGPQLFVFATNMDSKVDPAMISRFDFKAHFGAPTWEQVISVVDYWAEVLHAYGSDEWAERLKEAGSWNEGRWFLSFRMLWQAIQNEVKQYIERSMK